MNFMLYGQSGHDTLLGEGRREYRVACMHAFFLQTVHGLSLACACKVTKLKTYSLLSIFLAPAPHPDLLIVVHCPAS